MKKLLLCILVSASLIACTNQETKTNSDDSNIAIFKENCKVVEASMNAFTKNDPKGWDSYFADSAKFHLADYGKDAPDSALDLAATRLRLAGFHTIVKNLNAKFEQFVPDLDIVTYKPNGSVRAYIRMSAESISNGAKMSHKMYQVYTFNKDHKIVDIDEYFDVTGAVLVATAPKK